MADGSLATRLSDPMTDRFDDPEVQRRLRARCKKYAPSIDDYVEMWIHQDGRCVICRVVLQLRTAKIDHQHDIWMNRPNQRRVRGLLCGGCNSELANLEDVTPEEVDRQLLLLEEQLKHTQRQLELYREGRPLCLERALGYLDGKGPEGEVAESTVELLQAGKRRSWQYAAAAPGSLAGGAIGQNCLTPFRSGDFIARASSTASRACRSTPANAPRPHRRLSKRRAAIADEPC